MTDTSELTQPTTCLDGIRYQSEFLDPLESSQLFRTLELSMCWHREHFRLFGKDMLAPRHTSWAGDQDTNYRYTGIDHAGVGWPQCLADLKCRISAHAQQAFNFAVLNRYDNGLEHMGWHRDDERGAHPLIASLSLGATRRFRIQDEVAMVTHGFELGSGSLLIFDGRWRHQLTKTRKQVARRINITFRTIV